MFKLRASRLVGREMQQRTGEAFTVNGLKFAASNLVFLITGKRDYASDSVNALVEQVQRTYGQTNSSTHHQHEAECGGVKLVITMESR